MMELLFKDCNSLAKN